MKWEEESGGKKRIQKDNQDKLGEKKARKKFQKYNKEVKSNFFLAAKETGPH